MDSGPREPDGFLLGQHLGEVLLIEAQIPAGGQGDHAPPQLGPRRVGRLAPPIAMGNGLGPTAFIIAAHPTELPLRQTDQGGRFLPGDPARPQLVQHQQPALFFAAQPHVPLLHERTESLNG